MPAKTPRELIAYISSSFTGTIQHLNEKERGEGIPAYQLCPQPGLDCFPETLALLQHMFAVVSEQLLLPRISRSVYICFCLLSGEVGNWLFPAHLKGRRHNKDVEAVWGAVNCCKSILWLRKTQCCRQARAVLQVLLPHHRDAVCNRDSLISAGGIGLLKAAIQSMIYLQWQALTCQLPPDSQHSSMVYAWVGTGFAYCGLATRTRQSRQQRAHGGVLYRWLEHACSHRRISLPSSDRLRYRLARKFEVGHLSFLAVLAGSDQQMCTAETVAIRSLPFNANGGH